MAVVTTFVSAHAAFMDSVSDVLDLGFETVLAVGVIFNNTLGSIGLIQGVLAHDNIPIAHLPLALVVTGVVVLHSVLVLVFRVTVVLLSATDPNSTLKQISKTH